MLVYMDVPTSAQADLKSEGHIVWGQPSQHQWGALAPCSQGTILKAHSPAGVASSKKPICGQWTLLITPYLCLPSLSSAFGSSLPVISAYSAQSSWSEVFGQGFPSLLPHENGF